MPHPPYTTTIYPPIEDLEEYKRDLRYWRSQYDRNVTAESGDVEVLMELGETLPTNANFLPRSFRQKDALNEENEAQKREVTALKGKLEKAAATAGATAKQLSLDGNKTGIEINLENVKPGDTTDEVTLEKSKNSPETTRVANSLKRGPETDLTTDEKAAKRGKNDVELGTAEV